MASAVQADASQEFNAYSSDSEVDSQDALFTEAGRPVRFFLHESLPQKKKESAVQAIEAYGGLITVNHDKAQIILVEEKHLGCSFEILEARYGCHPDEKIRNIEVYRHSQLKTWIDSERFTIRKIRYERRLRGRKPGSRRVDFTEDDDKNLARYLADNTFQNSSLGRLGHKPYQRLMEMAAPMDDPIASGYSWARRHTMNSWRERYRKNRDNLDALIRHYAKKRRGDGKGSYWYTDDRDEAKQKSRRNGVRVELITDGEDEESEYDELEDDATWAEMEAQFTPTNTRKRKHSADKPMPGRPKRRKEGSVPPVEDTGHARGTSKKGKGKAKQTELEESSDPFDGARVFEGAHGEVDMHYDDEPGPSYTQQSPAPPSPTLVEHPPQPVRRRTRTRTVPPNAQPPPGSAPTLFVPPVQASPGPITRERARDAAVRALVSPSHGPAQGTSNAANVPVPTALPKGRAARKIASNSTAFQPRMVVNDLVASDPGMVIPDDGVVPSISGNSVQTGAEEDAVNDILNEDDIEESPDDAQTRQALEHPRGNSATADDQATNDEDSDEELVKRLQDKPQPRISPKSNPLPSESPVKQSPKIDLATVRSANRKQQPLVTTPLTRRTRAGRTAAKQAAAALLTTQRKAFPSPGTKASEVRDQWDEALKREEYQPPLGTKARELRQRTRR